MQVPPYRFWLKQYACQSCHKSSLQPQGRASQTLERRTLTPHLVLPRSCSSIAINPSYRDRHGDSQSYELYSGPACPPEEDPDTPVPGAAAPRASVRVPRSALRQRAGEGIVAPGGAYQHASSALLTRLGPSTYSSPRRTPELTTLTAGRPQMPTSSTLAPSLSTRSSRGLPLSLTLSTDQDLGQGGRGGRGGGKTSSSGKEVQLDAQDLVYGLPAGTYRWNSCTTHIDPRQRTSVATHSTSEPSIWSYTQTERRRWHAPDRRVSKR
ncbi:hypothetical protein BD413DRAFT_517562 [Trametes elegans]|nr:hypothetical protein BD413DRAFT_517562 [Trametes elegans]